MDIKQLFSETIRMQASDLHLIVGYPPMLRVSGKLTPVTGAKALTLGESQELVFATCSTADKELLLTNKEIDYSVAYGTNRFRANAYYQKGTIAADFRLIPDKIGSFAELGLPDICSQFVKLRQGFILVTGPTGCGKTTSLYSMLEILNIPGVGLAEERWRFYPMGGSASQVLGFPAGGWLRALVHFHLNDSYNANHSKRRPSSWSPAYPSSSSGILVKAIRKGARPADSWVAPK